MIKETFKLFDKQWALVTAGTQEDFNTMTISWGGLGTLWSKPCATVYVKPCRYTYGYMNDSEYFTVSFYDERYRDDLMILGTKSKRDGDKLSLTQLTPAFLDKGISFKEASCTLVCKKIYYQDLDINQIPQAEIAQYYTKEAPHRMYIGEVVEVIEHK
ncbi:MAG: flavin reductase [Erysipelotrichaceae bacterium]|nr:flavin reductase [Erysipelotrichaceae bacterium]MDY5251413.1 flavin reductase [Erysipelotrichaceae bacterium]